MHSVCVCQHRQYVMLMMAAILQHADFVDLEQRKWCIVLKVEKA
jgi:hypothetical protein